MGNRGDAYSFWRRFGDFRFIEPSKVFAVMNSGDRRARAEELNRRWKFFQKKPWAGLPARVWPGRVVRPRGQGGYFLENLM